MLFDVKKDYTLENEVVILRPLLESDFVHLLPFSINEPDLWKFSLIQAAGESGLKNYIRLALCGREKGTEYPFIVFDKKSKRYAGSTRFYDIQLPNRTTQLGYTWYGQDFQGTGLNKQCKWLLLNFAFDEMHLERVEFRADNQNKRSIAAMKSIGCVEEGVLRSSGPTADGRRRDSIVLSIIRNEWEQELKNRLKEKIHAF